MIIMPFSGSTSKQHIAMKIEVIRAEIFVSEAQTIKSIKIVISEVFPTLLQNIDFCFGQNWPKFVHFGTDPVLNILGLGSFGPIVS